MMVTGGSNDFSLSSQLLLNLAKAGEAALVSGNFVSVGRVRPQLFKSKLWTRDLSVQGIIRPGSCSEFSSFKEGLMDIQESERRGTTLKFLQAVIAAVFSASFSPSNFPGSRNFFSPFSQVSFFFSDT